MSDLPPTIGGVVTQGEVYTKLLYHLREAQNLMATMAHLIQMQDSSNPLEGLLAKGWLGMSEMMAMIIDKVTKLATKRLQ